MDISFSNASNVPVLLSVQKVVFELYVLYLNSTASQLRLQCMYAAQFVESSALKLLRSTSSVCIKFTAPNTASFYNLLELLTTQEQAIGFTGKHQVASGYSTCCYSSEKLLALNVSHTATSDWWLTQTHILPLKAAHYTRATPTHAFVRSAKSTLLSYHQQRPAKIYSQ